VTQNTSHRATFYRKMGQTHKLSKKSKLGSNKADRLLKKGSKVTFFGPTKSDPVLARGGSNFFFQTVFVFPVLGQVKKLKIFVNQFLTFHASNLKISRLMQIHPIFFANDFSPHAQPFVRDMNYTSPCQFLHKSDLKVDTYLPDRAAIFPILFRLWPAGPNFFLSTYTFLT
jgi:hypothetical protein